MEKGRIYWYRRFRTAAYAAIALGVVWTFLVILPVEPFSDLLPIMIGGGAGTWFLLGYVTYLAVGVGAFVALASLLATVEVVESRVPNTLAMTVGLVLLFVGVTATCLLLGLAGAAGGYAQTIQHTPESQLESLLAPYVDVARAGAMVAMVGAAATIYGIALARGEQRSE